MPRFFVGSDAITGSSAILTGVHAEHAKVLRLSPGEQVTLCTGDGTEHLCAVRSVNHSEIMLDVLSCQQSEAEPKHRIRVYMALAKSDKLEHVIQKATELGAFEIVAFSSQRCVSRPDDASLKKKCERWQKIAESAAEQCGRARIPTVRTMDFRPMLKEAAAAELPIFLYENETACSLRMAAQRDFVTASVVTGPEGGFSEEEVALAVSAGMTVCTLGKRILRCETAPLCALSSLMFHTGEFG